MKINFSSLAVFVFILFFSSNVSCQNNSNNTPLDNTPLYSTTVIQVDPSIKEPTVRDFAIAYRSVFYPKHKNELEEELGGLEELSNIDANIENSEEQTSVEWNKQLSVIEMRSGFDIDYSFRTWERKNGHKLFAVMQPSSAGEYGERELLFYDYNPLSNKLTPDTTLYNWFNERFRIRSLTLNIGDRKDIEGYYKNRLVRIRYNGYAFDEFKMKDIICSCFIEYFRIFDYPEKKLKIPAKISDPKIKDFAAVIAKSISYIDSYIEDTIYYDRGYYDEDVLDPTTTAIKRIDRDEVQGFYKPKYNFFDVTVAAGEEDYTYRCWKRDNGHTLVAFYCGRECDCVTYITVFYDYNPNTHELLPDLEMTEWFEKRYGGFSGKEYNVPCNLLSEKGGYIRVYKNPRELEEEIYLKWNGRSFVEL